MENIHEVKLIDTKDKHVFYDKLTLLYIEMPKFNKREDQLETMFDKWLFVLRNLSRLMERPAALQERIFERVFEQAEIARYSETERREYEESVNAYRDINNAVNTARREGLEEGIEVGMEKGRKEGIEAGRKEGIETGRKEERLALAKSMKADGMPLPTIEKYTNLTAEEISKL